MSAPNLTGWKRRIRTHCDANGIDKTDSQIQRMAIKICKRMTAMNVEMDFYTALRILGLSSDTTARDAIIPKAVPVRWIAEARTGDLIAEGMVQA